MDNVITSLHDAVSQLQMHARILQDVGTRWSKLYWQAKLQQLGIAFGGGSLTTTLAMYGSGVVPLQVTGGVLAATVVALGGSVWYQSKLLDEWERQASSPEELSAAFQRTYSRQVSDGDEYVAALWQRVRDPIRTALLQVGIGQLLKVSSSDLMMLQTILDSEIPALRRVVSPPHYGKDVDAE